MRRIHLDHAGTTPTHPEVVKAMLPCFTEAFGNPSSVYSYGQEARGAVEKARTKVVELIGARGKVNDGVIVDAKFKTFGCGATIATSSIVTELVKGKNVKEALKISNKAVAEALDELPPLKMRYSVLAEEALKSAIEDYLARHNLNR